ncbi:MAG TPA: DUF5362 family protein [Polyangiaceae bacterium]|nr:DUF5362 family protein [Polyangiaceae bacterium]
MNPYAPPTTPYAPPPAMAPPAPGGMVPEQSVEMLRQTRPWVMLMGVLCFIGSAFMLLGGLAVIAMGALAAATAGGKSAAPMALGIVYIPLSALYIYPGLKLTKFGGAIGRLVQSRAAPDLDAALEQQKSFWKFAGITTVVMIVLYIFVIIGAMAVGVGTAMMVK